MRWGWRTIRTRLFVGFGLSIVTILAAGIVGVRELGLVHRQVETDLGAVAESGSRLLTGHDATLRQVLFAQADLVGADPVEPAVLDRLSSQADSIRRLLSAETNLTTDERAQLELVGALQGRIEVRLALARLYRRLGQDDAAYLQADSATRALDTLLRASAGVTAASARQIREADAVIGRRVTRYRRWLAGCLFVALMGSSWLAWMTWRKISRPLDTLVVAANELGAGKLNVAIAEGDMDREYQALARALTQTGQQLGAVVRQIQTEATQLTGAARLLDDAAAGTAASISAMTTSLADAEEATERVMASAAQAKTTSGTIGRTSAMAGTQIRQAVQALSGTEGLIRETNDRMTHLGAKSQRVEQFVGVSQRVADKTRLLALNALIEAARAQEHGRGFAVVAGEVRHLAADSAEAAEEARAVLQSIFGEIDVTVQAFDAGSQRLGDVSAISREAAEAMAEIEAAVGNVDTVADAIEQASHQTGDAMASLGRKLRDISAEEDTPSSESRDGESASVQHVAMTAREVRCIADRLEDLVSRFGA